MCLCTVRYTSVRLTTYIMKMYIYEQLIKAASAYTRFMKYFMKFNNRVSMVSTSIAVNTVPGGKLYWRCRTLTTTPYIATRSDEAGLGNLCMYIT